MCMHAVVKQITNYSTLSEHEEDTYLPYKNMIITAGSVVFKVSYGNKNELVCLYEVDGKNEIARWRDRLGYLRDVYTQQVPRRIICFV